MRPIQSDCTVKNRPYKGPVNIGELVPLTENQTYAAFARTYNRRKKPYMGTRTVLVLARKFGAISKFEKKIETDQK